MRVDPGPSLRDLGEDAVIRRLTDPLRPSADVLAGPGDDCAVLAGAAPGIFRLLKTDCVIEGIHFTPDTVPERVGWKAAARVVSDFAAMGGGQPAHALVTLVTPPERPIGWAEALYAGLSRCAREHGFRIVGGESSRPPAAAPATVISVSLSGTIPADRCRFRSGGRPGHSVWVTGHLGGSFASGKHLDFRPRLREARWLSSRWPVSAMMDLSDGLGRDLPRLADRSGTSYRLDTAALPCSPGCSSDQACTDGEDYELLFALERPPTETDLAAWHSAFPDLPLTRIGLLTTPSADPAPASSSAPGGWDAYRSSP
jgi:thiamine-monophosphate kinase